MASKKPIQEAEKKISSRDIKFSDNLWIQIFIGLFAGLALGLYLSMSGRDWQEIKIWSEWLALPGHIFIDLLKMIIIPLIISSIVLGIAASHSKEFLKKLGFRIIPYFIFTTAIAITIGLSLVHFVNPGQYVDGETLQASVSTAGNLETFDDLSVPQRIRNLIPVNLTQLQYHEQMLQIVIFAIILGIVILTLPEKNTKVVLDLAYFAQDASMVVVGWAVALAPIAVFGLLASITAKIGLSALTSMAAYMLTVIVGLLAVFLMYLIIVALIGRRNPFSFWAHIKEVQLLAFSTSTSSGVMPLTISAAEQNLKVKPEISRFVVPLGATINMDGTALYQGVAAIFLTQIYGIDLSVTQMVMLLLTTIGASIGTPGTPGVGLIILATIITGIGVPAEGVALILGVDRILDMCRTTINVSGDLTASVVMDRWLSDALPTGKKKAKKAS